LLLCGRKKYKKYHAVATVPKLSEELKIKKKYHIVGIAKINTTLSEQ
jgi:hypothetical protein